jgi:uncharacterized integral membrane protein
MIAFILFSLLLVAVAVFALQNPGVVPLRFLAWEVQTSVAVLTLAATTAGAVIAGLLALAGRVRRWRRVRTPPPPAPPAGRAPGTPEPGPLPPRPASLDPPSGR